MCVFGIVLKKMCNSKNFIKYIFKDITQIYVYFNTIKGDQKIFTYIFYHQITHCNVYFDTYTFRVYFDNLHANFHVRTNYFYMIDILCFTCKFQHLFFRVNVTEVVKK